MVGQKGKKKKIGGEIEGGEEEKERREEERDTFKSTPVVRCGKWNVTVI